MSEWHPISTAPKDREICAPNGEQARMVWPEGPDWAFTDLQRPTVGRCRPRTESAYTLATAARSAGRPVSTESTANNVSAGSPDDAWKFRQRHVAEMLFQHKKQRCIVRGALPRFEDVELSEPRDNAGFRRSARRFEDCFGLGDGDVLSMRSMPAKKAPNLSEDGASAI